LKKKKAADFNSNFDLDFGSGNDKSLWRIDETLKHKAKGLVCVFHC